MERAPASWPRGVSELGHLQALPMYSGCLCVDTSGMEESEKEALRLWALLVGGALERCFAHQQLTQGSKLAAIGQLAAGVAHELNTPLGAVTIALEMAARNLESDPERAESRLKMASQAAQQMRDIIDKLLHYARSGGSARENVSLEKVIGDTSQLLLHSFQEDGVVLKLDLQDETALVNRNEIQQILLNLMVNARQAASTRKPAEVRVALRGRGSTVEIEVSDSGPGVPPEILDRIFEPFFTSKEVGQGLGLGLSIAREIAEQHGGRLEFTGGSRFLLSIPKTVA